MTTIKSGGLSAYEHSSIFVVRDVTKTYSQKVGSLEPHVLGEISFSIEEGTFVSIIGPSGCGKTTLLRMLAGLTKPTSGSILFRGAPVCGANPDRTIIFQDYGLFEWKNVLANVEFGLKAKGLGKAERRSVAKRLIASVHLSGSEEKYPGELSGGMKQRAAIARALAVDPECVLMDEPFAALDAQTRLVLQEEILQIWESTHQTVVLVTHSVEEAVFLSDRVFVLSGSPAKIVLDLPIGLPRPRRTELRRDSHFLRLSEELWLSLRSQAAKHR